MAGLQRLLICAIAFATAVSISAQESERPEDRKQKRGKNGLDSPELENVRKAIEALSPEQKKRFTQNFAKWANLSPEEKRELRDRDALRRKRMGQDIDRALEEAGLQLQGPQRAQFAKRYVEERRRLEERLRKETEEKRAPAIREIVGRLKDEFSTTATGTAGTTAPSASAAVP